MYCNLFDTVRTEISDYVQTEGLFFHMLLSGYRPTLSMNQAVDSNAISLLSGKQAVFRDFIDRKLIRVSRFGNFESTLDYMTLHLLPQEGKVRNSFHFSSLPFLYTGEYTDADIQRIYNAMLAVLQDEGIDKLQNVTASGGHAELLHAHLYAARDLADRLEGKYLDPSGKASALLGQRVEGFIQQVQTQRPDIVIPPVVLKLQDHIHKFRRDKGLDPSGALDHKYRELDNRSYLYNQIDVIAAGDKVLSAEAKKIVDLCYNERVATSINDGEDDLMVTDTGITSLYHYAQHDAKDSKTHIVGPADVSSPYATRFMTWEGLRTVFDLVDARKPAPEDRREVIARCCEDVGLPRFEPGYGIAEQEIRFTSTVLLALKATSSSNDPVRKNPRDWAMNVTRHKVHRSQRGDTYTDTAALKSDYAKEVK